MGRVYTVSIDNVTVTNAGGDSDILELTLGDDRPVEIMGWHFVVTSETGDAAEEFIRYKLISGYATSGSTPEATPTARAADTSMATAATTTAEVENATVASAGTPIDHFSGGFNVRSGEWVLLPKEFRFKFDQSDVLVVFRLMNTFADDVSISGTVWFEEL